MATCLRHNTKTTLFITLQAGSPRPEARPKRLAAGPAPVLPGPEPSPSSLSLEISSHMSSHWLYRYYLTVCCNRRTAWAEWWWSNKSDVGMIPWNWWMILGVLILLLLQWGYASFPCPGGWPCPCPAWPWAFSLFLESWPLHFRAIPGETAFSWYTKLKFSTLTRVQLCFLSLSTYYRI